MKDLRDLEKMIENKPLVSVIVTTYNSEKFVIETLESIKSQTYQNIELIISDDDSKDDTIPVCESWILENNARFVSTTVITTPNNTGIPANCNRGIKVSKGEWLKIIAGDDALTKNAIEHVVNYANSNEKIAILSSNVGYYNNTFEKKNFFRTKDQKNNIFYSKSAKGQYNSLLHSNSIHALGVYAKRKLFVDLDGYDEKFKLLEDHPMWLKVTKANVKFYYLDEITGLYRIHDNSLFSTIKETKIFNDYYLKKRAFELEYIYPNINWFYRIGHNFEFYRLNLIDYLNLNKKNRFGLAFYEVTKFMMPLEIKKNLSKLVKKVRKVFK